MRGTPEGGNTAEERGSHRQRARARLRAADAVAVRETMRQLVRWRYLRRQRRRRCLDLVVLHRDHRRVSNVAGHRQDAKGDHDKEADEQRGVMLACVEIKILRRVRAESSRCPPRHRRDACSLTSTQVLAGAEADDQGSR